MQCARLLVNKFEVEPVVCTCLHHWVCCQFRSGFLVYCLRNISQRNAFQYECNLGKPLSVWEKPCHLSIVQIAFDPLLPSFKQALCSICSGPTFFISCKKQVPIWTWPSWYLSPPPVLFFRPVPLFAERTQNLGLFWPFDVRQAARGYSQAPGNG